MVTPSGLRSSAPMPVPSIRGRALKRAQKVVMRMGRRRRRQASWMADRLSLPSLFSASRAKSTIMMAFFLTMPMSRIRPMMPTTPSSMSQSVKASRAPMPAEGRVDMMVTGWT